MRGIRFQTNHELGKPSWRIEAMKNEMVKPKGLHLKPNDVNIWTPIPSNQPRLALRMGVQLRDCGSMFMSVNTFSHLWDSLQGPSQVPSTWVSGPGGDPRQAGGDVLGSGHTLGGFFWERGMKQQDRSPLDACPPDSWPVIFKSHELDTDDLLF